jgi:hypothetical protein
LSSVGFLLVPLLSRKNALEARIIYLSILFHPAHESLGTAEGVGTADRTLLDPCSRDINNERKQIRNKNK